MEKYINGFYCHNVKHLKALNSDNSRKILERFRQSYPNDLTIQEISTKLNMDESAVSHYVMQLLDKGFIQKGKVKRTPHLKVGQKPANTYSFEDFNFVLNQEKGFQYQFAPGSVQYSEQFLEMYQSIVDRTSEDHIFRLLVQFLEEIFTEAGHHKISLLPETKKDFRCPGCGVNHEVRDFIRAILLHLIDQLEMDDTFVKFLYRNDFVSEEGYNELRKVVFSKSHVPSLKRKKRLVNLRIVSINEGLENRLGRFLAIDKEGTIGHGTIDNSLLHTIHSEAIIECDPSVFDINTDGGFYVALYSGDSIKIMKDDPSFPKLQQILTKIEYIKKLIGTDAFDTHGNIYVIEAIILLAPKLVERFIHGRSVQALDTIIGDETGEIRLVGQYRHPEELQVGDRIIVIGAFEKPTIETFHHDLIFTDIELRLSPYGSIIKKERK